MQRKSHIVSFDDARRDARERRFASDYTLGSVSRRSSSGSQVAEVSRRRTSEAPAVAWSAQAARSAKANRFGDAAGGLGGGSVASMGSGIVAHSRSSQPRTPSWYDVPLEAKRSNNARGGRPALEEDEPFDNEAANAAVRGGGGNPFAALAGKLTAAKRSRNKDKADKRFTKQYGGSDSASSGGGPRAAVYKGEMGTQHRKSSRMQNNETERSGKSHNASPKKERRSFGIPVSTGGLKAVGVAVICVLFCGAFLYSPAQQYYQELRERDRLSAEYAAIQQRNDAIQGEVNVLSSLEGVEDRAREEFGWVKEGESAGSVSGINVAEEESNFTANIVPGSVPAPETWYSGVLDPFFGVK